MKYNSKILWNSKIMKFQRREKRFLAYMINSQNEELLTYCCNPGKMADILVPHSNCIVTSKEGGIPYQWQAIKIEDEWIGVNTAIPNQLVQMMLPQLFPDVNFKAEKAFGQYRADFASDNIIIEVKNVHWKKDGIAYFPDCVTARGARQILDLIKLGEKYTCYVIYIVQRQDIKFIKIADFIDKTYYTNYKLATHIHTLAFSCNIDENGIGIDKEIKFIKP